MATQDKSSEVNFDSIDSLLIKESEKTDRRAHCKTFLPNEAADSLVKRGRVETTLEKCFGKEELYKKAITGYVMKRAKKVFLILCFMEEGRNRWETLQRDDFKFGDSSLPIRQRQTSSEGEGGPQAGTWVESFVGSSRFRRYFYEGQWLFLAPTFRRSQFIYEFDYECRLPFVDIEGAKTYAGHFGSVFQLGLRIDHTAEYPISRMQMKKGYVEVGLKVTTVPQSYSTDKDGTDVEKFYVKETGTLDLMRRLDHPHLIAAMAAYKRGHYRCFIFPWAEGGNLHSFWRGDSSKLDKNLVTWAVRQMSGISEGIEKLHDARVRHGDIKPLNILYFKGSDNGSPWGELVVADVGLAKVHEAYTTDRVPGTTTKHGTNMYEPPEMVFFSRERTRISHRYDMWSLGCVFFEFTIWLLYGQQGLDSFYRELEASDIWRFWVPAENGQKLHEAVEIRVEEIESKLDKEGALGRLVRLISGKLLVRLEKRIDAKSLARALKSIQTECPVESLRSLGPGVDNMAKQRPGPSQTPRASQGLISPSNERTSKLDGQWRTIRYNSWARIIISRIGWAPLRPKMETTELCVSCRMIDFLESRLSLARSLSGLDPGRTACPMCRFLYQCLSKFPLVDDEIVGLTIDKDKNAYLPSHETRPAISIYFDSESSVRPLSEAQLGLPLLPTPGSSQQFKLINEWVRLCDKYHQCIASPAINGIRSILPTRLVDVGTSHDPSLRLIDTKDGCVSDLYVALSHCWGALPTEKRVCTYTDNIGSFKKGIPFHILPRSFQDAVTVTRALRVRYLWIDSLCIIQGNTEDWKTEAGKMEDVFSSAYCTIAASSATSSLDGFLFNRAQRASIGIQTPKGTLYLAEAIDDFEAHVEKGVLNTRGWVLQERALSRRTIHFTSTQVYWECGEGVHCETLAELGNRQSMFLGDSNFPTYGLEHYKDERIRLVQYLYQVYSGLDLTKPYDRSKAILGLQKRLGSTFKSKAKYGVISAYFERTFLWHADVPGSLTKIDYELSSTVPSWSWMAFMGKVRYIGIPFGGVTWTGDLENPFHAGFDDAKWDGRLVAKAKRLVIDYDVLHESCKVDVSPYEFEPNSWKCVVVGEGKVANQDGDIDQYVLLIRERSSGVTPPVYERVGVGILSQRHIALETTIIHIA